MRLSRLLAVPAFASAIMAAQLVGISPANAAINDLACHYDHTDSNACLYFEDVGDEGKLDAHVGLDAYMSQEYAHELVSHGADFRASLWGDDGDRDQFIADLTVASGWPSAGPGGLGVEFVGNSLARSSLNEDKDDKDEIYAKISYFDYHGQGRRVSFTTGIVRGEFTYLPPGPGTPQCLVLC
ncbi:MAG TPA: hypothetical protein VIU87_20935 [Mycobacterium sp.]